MGSCTETIYFQPNPAGQATDGSALSPHPPESPVGLPQNKSRPSVQAEGLILPEPSAWCLREGGEKACVTRVAAPGLPASSSLLPTVSKAPHPSISVSLKCPQVNSSDTMLPHTRPGEGGHSHHLPPTQGKQRCCTALSEGAAALATASPSASSPPELPRVVCQVGDPSPSRAVKSSEPWDLVL